MDKIRWIFYPRFLKEEIVPFLFLIVFLLIVFILSYSFVKMELDKNGDRRKKRER